MVVKSESKNKDLTLSEGMDKVKEDHPRFFKKLEKL
jgi:hypothetical protein